MSHNIIHAEKEPIYKEYKNINGIHEIISVSSSEYTIKDYKGLMYSAELAASCIMIPRVDDIVATTMYGNIFFITSIIKSHNLEPKEFHLKGLVKAGLDESYIDIDAQNIRIETKSINLISKIFTSITSTSKWFSASLSLKARHIKQCSDYSNIECKQTLTIDTKNNKANIKELNSQIAQTTIQNSRNINITTDKLNINS